MGWSWAVNSHAENESHSVPRFSMTKMYFFSDAVNCQDGFPFLGEEDQEELDELLKSITLAPNIRIFTDTWWEEYTSKTLRSHLTLFYHDGILLLSPQKSLKACLKN